MKTVLIIGGGPAGLTAAYELAKTQQFRIIVLEKERQLGGISRTLLYKGNRIDIGGHRFFSKSDTVMHWWNSMMPLQGAPSCDDIALNRSVPLSTQPNAPDPEKVDNVMLVRSRLSRIYFLRKFFPYPIALSLETMGNLGLVRMMKIGFSYTCAMLFKRKEKSLEDFFINRFGKELYNTFFKDYTEKVWGVACSEIEPDWGAQRVKKLSITKVLAHAIKKLRVKRKLEASETETSLIEEFWYPKLGPGQLWERVGELAIQMGVTIHMRQEATKLLTEGNRITGVQILSLDDNQTRIEPADYIISTMPIKELVAKIDHDTPENVRQAGQGLVYRDFMTVGILLNKLKIQGNDGRLIPDNWIYIQEPDVKVGRLQIFNNWSPYLLHDKTKAWIGMEYFVNEGDALWNMGDKEFCDFAAKELEQIGIIDTADVVDSTVFRIEKAYPAYFGTYKQFPDVRKYLDTFANLYLIGRNGMHRYNNMDHSMLSAMQAVNNIIADNPDKANIWNVNADQEYHESK